MEADIASKEPETCARKLVSPTIEQDEAEELVAALKALAHPVRLRIVNLIHAHGGELCVQEFKNHLDVNQSTISQHLTILREGGVIHSRKHRSWVHHFVRKDTFERLRAHMALFAASS